MNQDAKQMREFCQKRLIELHSDIAPAEQVKIMIVMLDQIHKRLALQEGATLQSLEDITLE